MSGAAQRPTGSAAVPPRALQAKQEANYIRPVEGKSARGLTWRGCWGCSSTEIGIYVLATVVGHIHLQPLQEGSEAEYKAALQDVRRLLQESLPASAVLANVTWARACPQSSGRMAEVAIVGTLTACQRLQQNWQGKKLCGGLVVGTWTSLNDTASETHADRMAEMVEKELRGPRRRTLALEVPTRWVEGEAPKQVNQLGPRSLWYRFCVLFGEVTTLELVRPMGSHSTVQLLISYKEPEFAGAFREALTDRCLIFMNSSIPDDCHPVICVPGDGYSLREYFCSGASREKKGEPKSSPAVVAPVAGGASTPKAPTHSSPRLQGGFLLRRCGRGEVSGALRPAPDTFAITKVQMDFGREDTCDVVLRHQHVSKVHAVFVLQTLPEGAGDMLLMQDSSSNGTWINGIRMVPGRFQQLQPGDRVSFLQPTTSLEEDVATWEVRRDASVVVQPAAKPAAATPAAETGPLPVPPARTRGPLQVKKAETDEIDVVDGVARARATVPAPAPPLEKPLQQGKQVAPDVEKAKVTDVGAPGVAPGGKVTPSSQHADRTCRTTEARKAAKKPVAKAAEATQSGKSKPPKNDVDPLAAQAPKAAAKAQSGKPKPPKNAADPVRAQAAKAAPKAAAGRPVRRTVPEPPDEPPEKKGAKRQATPEGMKIRAAAKTRPELRRGREVEADMEVEAEPLDPEALAQGYAALAAAYAQAAAEEDRTQVEVPVLAAAAAAALKRESLPAVAPPPPPPPPPPVPPWRTEPQILPPPLKRPRVETPSQVPVGVAIQAAGNFLSQMRQLKPKVCAAPPGSEPPRVTPYVDMPVGGTQSLSEDLASNDIVSWSRAWRLEHYQATLLRNYDDVDQICSLHKDDLNGFFQDNQVSDEADRLAFTHAIQGRQAFVT